MLQLIPILLVMAVLAADAGMVVDLPGPEPGIVQVVLLSVLPTILVVLFAWAWLWRIDRRIEQGRCRSLEGAHRVRAGATWLILFNYLGAMLFLGWLDVSRQLSASWLLLEAMVAMGPAILGLLAIWWSWYPIERRLRDARMLRQVDEGLPAHAAPGRGAYVLQQLRMNILLLLVPMLLIVCAVDWIETGAEEAAEQGTTSWNAFLFGMLSFGAALVILVLAPLIARWLLGLRSMPRGEVRDDMERICARHGVGVRDIMLWRTGGMVINAAVMGFVPLLRYLLLTDALLEQLPRRHVLAVMSHEVGHVRRRHMFTLLLSLIAIVAVAELAILGVKGVWPWFQSGDTAEHDLLHLALGLLIVIPCFGWVSRRIERQADTFAVQDLSMHPDQTTETTDGNRISPEAVDAMAGSLELIASLHGIQPRRHSWRHGSIAWRCAHLRSLVGRPCEGLVIDRVVSRILWFSIAVILLAGVIQVGFLS